MQYDGHKFLESRIQSNHKSIKIGKEQKYCPLQCEVMISRLVHILANIVGVRDSFVPLANLVTIMNASRQIKEILQGMMKQ